MLKKKLPENLLPDEKILFESNLIHPILYLVPLITMAVAIILASVPSIATYGLFLVTIAGITFITTTLSIKTGEFAITDKRILARTGAFKPKIWALDIKEVGKHEFKRALLLGEALGYGTLHIEDKNGIKTEFEHMPKASEVEKILAQSVPVK